MVRCASRVTASGWNGSTASTSEQQGSMIPKGDMVCDGDLRSLAAQRAPARGFLTITLAGPRSVADLPEKLQVLRKALDPAAPAGDERSMFDANVELVRTWFERHPLRRGSLALFACGTLELFCALPQTARLEDLVWIDASAYVRPLAELDGSCEPVALLLADAARARVFLVSAEASSEPHRVIASVTDRFAAGGWSAQRCELRRQGSPQAFAAAVVEALARLYRDSPWRHLLTAGDAPTLQAIESLLPAGLKKRGLAPVVPRDPGGLVRGEFLKLTAPLDGDGPRELWDRIRSEHLRAGLAVVGLDSVLGAARIGRADLVIASNPYHPAGRRCDDCANLDMAVRAACPACGSPRLRPVDSIEELARLCEQTGARFELIDRIETLAESGHVAALLRH
jgi:hypothetical protein